MHAARVVVDVVVVVVVDDAVVIVIVVAIAIVVVSGPELVVRESCYTNRCFCFYRRHPLLPIAADMCCC